MYPEGGGNQNASEQFQSIDSKPNRSKNGHAINLLSAATESAVIAKRSEMHLLLFFLRRLRTLYWQRSCAE